jgi:hypothetical protein
MGCGTKKPGKQGYNQSITKIQVFLYEKGCAKKTTAL